MGDYLDEIFGKLERLKEREFAKEGTELEKWGKT